MRSNVTFASLLGLILLLNQPVVTVGAGEELVTIIHSDSHFENEPYRVAYIENGGFFTRDIRFEFDLDIFADTRGTEGTTFGIEFETESGDLKSVVFDQVGDGSATGSVSSNANGVVSDLGSYVKGVTEKLEVYLEADRWVISRNGVDVLDQAFPANEEGFVVRMILRNPEALPNDGTGIVEWVGLTIEGIYFHNLGPLVPRREVTPGVIPIPDPPGPIVIDPGGGTGTVWIPSFTTKVDALIGGSPKEMRGDGVYNRTGRGQTIRQKARPGRSARFYVALENDGDRSGRMGVTGRSGSRHFRVTYVSHLGPQTAANVTGAVEAGRFLTEPLSRGASARLRVVVRPAARFWRKRKRLESARAIVIRSRSVDDPDSVDVVKGVIQGAR